MHSQVCQNENRQHVYLVYLMYDLMFIWLAHVALLRSAISNGWQRA